MAIEIKWVEAQGITEVPDRIVITNEKTSKAFMVKLRRIGGSILTGRGYQENRILTVEKKWLQEASVILKKICEEDLGVVSKQLRKKVEELDTYVATNKYEMAEIDYTYPLPVIQVTRRDCEVLFFSQFTKQELLNLVDYRDENGNKDYSKIVNVVTYELCALEMALPGFIYKQLGRLDMTEVWDQSETFLEADHDALTAKAATMSRMNILEEVFWFLVFLVKPGVDPEHGRTEENLRLWAKNRFSAFSRSLGRATTEPELSRIQYTGMHISAWAHAAHVQRAIIVDYVLNYDIENPYLPPRYRPSVNSLLEQVKMIWEWGELATFSLAYNFAYAAETEAHLILPVVEQSIKVVRLMEQLKPYGDATPEDAEKSFRLKPYSSLLNQAGSDYDASNYPDLLNAAIFYRIANGEESFKNIVHFKRGLHVSRDELEQAVKRTLKGIEGAFINKTVRDFLRKKGKKPPKIGSLPEGLHLIMEQFI